MSDKNMTVSQLDAEIKKVFAAEGKSEKFDELVNKRNELLAKSGSKGPPSWAEAMFQNWPTK